MESPCTVEEEHQKPPEPLKVYQGVIVNQLLSVSPSFLKFPHDNSSVRVQRITLFNKTKRFLGFRVQEPRTKYFTVFYENYGLNPGSEQTIIVKCKPYDQKMCFDSLKIHITTESADILTIPVELLPSAEWFVLPKYITMPSARIGESVTKIIDLPSPPKGDHPYYFFISGTKPDAITVSPVEGNLGAPCGPEKLTLTYSPREYTSLVYKMSVHFPELEFQPYNLTIYMSCSPQINECETFDTITEAQPIAKKPTARLPKKPKLPEVKNDEIDEVPPPLDVFTPAGVMKFLLKRGGKSTFANEFRGPTGQAPAEEERIYKLKEKAFHDELNKVTIHQKTMLLQHTRNFLGEEAIDSTPELLMGIHRETERANLEYQKALGMQANDPEDLVRSKLKMMRQRPVRNIDYDYKSIPVSGASNFQVPIPTDPAGKRWTRRVILRRFIQAALIVITRRRADKRIVKLKVMIKDVNKARQKEANSRKPESETAYLQALEMINAAKLAEIENLEAEQTKQGDGSGRKKTLTVNDRNKSLGVALGNGAPNKKSKEAKNKKTSLGPSAGLEAKDLKRDLVEKNSPEPTQAPVAEI